MRKIKSVEVFGKNGRRLNKKRFYELVGGIIKIIPPPPPKGKVVVTYYRTPKELQGGSAPQNK